MPSTGVSLRNLTDERRGFLISGPASRRILEELAHEDVSNEAFGFLDGLVTGRGYIRTMLDQTRNE